MKNRRQEKRKKQEQGNSLTPILPHIFPVFDREGRKEFFTPYVRGYCRNLPLREVPEVSGF